MIPVRSDGGPRKQPVFNAPPVTLWTCAALVAMFALVNLVGPHAHHWIMSHLAFASNAFEAQFADGGPGVSPVAMTSLVTHALLHLNFMHLVLNTGFLLAFGTVVERRFGGLAFGLIFACSAAVGALTEVVFGGPRIFYLIGASGAVYGMMGAFVAMMARRGGAARNTALNFVVIVLVLNLLLAMLGISDFLAGGAQVAWRAHIGGFVAGTLLSFGLQAARTPISRK